MGDTVSIATEENDMRNLTTHYPFHDMPKHEDTLTFAERLALAVNHDDNQLPMIEYTVERITLDEKK